MKTLLLLALSLSVSTSAFAYSDGTYRCKSSEGVENSYKIETVSIGGSLRAPFIEAVLHYRQNPGDKNSPLIESTVRGLGTVSTTGTTEMLTLNGLRFEFENGELTHCKQ